jgi:hypothetical protein
MKGVFEDVFDHSGSDEAWAKMSNLDHDDPRYKALVEVYLQLQHEENEVALEKLRELEANAAGALCPSCEKPEVDHIWLTESELNEWRPQEGFKKNSCARKLSSDSTEDPPPLIFKVWSPPENPCDEEYMEEISE